MGWLNAFRRRGTGGPVTVRARLEGAMSQRHLRGWVPPLENFNSLVASSGPRLLARSRELVETNGYAAKACEAFASNLVGDGIKPSSLIEDPALRNKGQRMRRPYHLVTDDVRQATYSSQRTELAAIFLELDAHTLASQCDAARLTLKCSEARFCLPLDG